MQLTVNPSTLVMPLQVRSPHTWHCLYNFSLLSSIVQCLQLMSIWPTIHTRTCWLNCTISQPYIAGMWEHRHVLYMVNYQMQYLNSWRLHTNKFTVRIDICFKVDRLLLLGRRIIWISKYVCRRQSTQYRFLLANPLPNNYAHMCIIMSLHGPWLQSASVPRTLYSQHTQCLYMSSSVHC